METIYSTNHVPRGENDDHLGSPAKCRKLNINMRNSINETAARQLSLILSRINNPLPTKVDINVINTKFCEKPLRHEKQLFGDNKCEVQEKRSLNIITQISKTYLEYLTSDTSKPVIMDHEKVWAYYDDDYALTWTDMNRTEENLSEIMDLIDICRDNGAVESRASYVSQSEGGYTISESCPTAIDEEQKCTDSHREKPHEGDTSSDDDSEENACSCSDFFYIFSKSEIRPHCANKDSSMLRLLDMCQKVRKDMVEMKEIDVKLPKQHYCKKRTKKTIAPVRDGIAKSCQPSRSDVSRTNHRKPPREDDEDNIQDNCETLSDVEASNTIPSINTSISKPTCYNNADGYDVTDDAQPAEQTNLIMPDTLDALYGKDKSPTPRETQQRAAATSSPVRLPIFNSPLEVCRRSPLPRASLRPRLLSESSVESEDSFYIVFEDESESMVDCDEISCSDQDSEDESTSTINEDEQNTSDESMIQSKKVYKRELPFQLFYFLINTPKQEVPNNHETRNN